MYSFIENEDGDLQFIAFNRLFHARLVTAATDRANEILIGLEEEPISVPLGQALDSNILAQYGPNVPIRMVPIGAARADIYLEMQEAGINTVAIVSRLVVEADVRIVIPFTAVEAHVQTEVPVSIDIIPGGIPQYYFRGSQGHSNQQQLYEGQTVPLPTIPLPQINVNDEN
ncbi:sporulation protein YunB [Caldalkalibacillus uzonensis]|uniref:Sporulation protein YunB n=1 Tax=Caldalkalibacillus uzonensis TaxID=353224 RepID=A0ABU0CYG3_9BACI|nr:sporulation protein YunB [Caldalkalibacillus uzonensis]MDQ0341185.1 sporulation protein YunB [Caldalkalibacillus uzonensis]